MLDYLLAFIVGFMAIVCAFIIMASVAVVTNMLWR